MKRAKLIWTIPVLGLLALSACKSTPTPEMTTRPDFLSTYDHLQKIEPGVWRYASPPLLANCSKFIIAPVQVLFDEYKGQPITAEQRQRTADFIRQELIVAIGQRYPIESQPGPDVCEIRIALTGGYRTGGKLGMSVQGEILDHSNTQVAAVVRTELGENYTPEWENRETARTLVEGWAQRLVKLIDDSRRK